MADVHTPEQRSFNMSRVKSKDTKPELMVRKFLHAHGFRYKLHDNTLPGKPDIVLPKYKTVIFVHGCFYHGHEGCRYFVVPKTRTEWWLNKINGNRLRDAANNARISEANWRIVTVFECELKPKSRQLTLQNLLGLLKPIST
ncbi:DNA mismatch endonuclease Vsr (plasmid) [Spirosoma taeanense]|uniref:Very short patch repair endonuclease n=1 Tax=Spirosoma taeanense TaxID=2735870 RepID=A0A6M5YGK2_9BACT|nr:DNA mismatch endonuclease Vsr [Spirosoma taeanense]QJW92471.1 DNA mismatch endonuclease Vsr [Spirosoma taeanense]